MPFITNIIRDYANVNDPGVPFDDPGFRNGGSTSIINQGGDNGPNLDWVAISGALLGIILVFFVPYLIWRIKYHRGDGARKPGSFQRLRKMFGGGGQGHHDHELGSMPPNYLYTGPGHPNAAKSEGSLPP